ncbi:hypothetical protein AVEN_73387-1 [Araneus ventricosus]|uniref:Uncharacterized protein n=1 Tax=Araneus ventricosus TaxID=182803 RepID=A0A4Y2UFL6_ARAVE|nr:hypothetical protein AVEN_73387-1 [Araneus ventricosus]
MEKKRTGENLQRYLSVVLIHHCSKFGAGGFKHDIALLMWLQRWSEEPAVTSVKSYWRKSNLSYVSTSMKFIKGIELAKNN